MHVLPMRRRLRTMAGALARERELRRHDTWSRAELEAHQQERLEAVVRHAAARSAVYRERLAGLDPARPVALADVPPVTKDELMERFDDWVCDPRLRRVEVERHLAGLRGDELLHGEFRVMATGGSTGRRGVFCYSGGEWTAFCGLMLRAMRANGLVPRIPRVRFATVMAPGPAHMTWRFGASIDVGAHRRLALAATDRLEDLVAALNAFRPDALAGFPSVVGLLVDEQREGRLRIAPRIVTTSSELRPPEVTAGVREVWGVEPHEVYGATDGLWGATCEHHRMHFFEDEAIVEVEDDRLLVTNLFLRTQPIVRYEITDLVRLDPEPCPCGRPSRTVTAIEGRSDDVLQLPAAGGATVAVHPMHLRSPMTRLDGVRQYQVVREDGGLRVLVVPRGDGAGVAGEVEAAMRGALARAGADADATPVHVETVDAIAREGGAAGKFKLVRA
jgi:phenylacetate-CoA ligase